MLNRKPLNQIIFLDIVTTSQYPSFIEMPDKLQQLFIRKFENELHKESMTAEAWKEHLTTLYAEKAPLYAEFGKIVCISGLRLLYNDSEGSGDIKYKVLSITGDNDKDILTQFLAKFKSLNTTKAPEDYLCSWAGTFFDFPFIVKRMIINGIIPPPMFDFAESKPWDRVHLIDPMDTWRFGGNGSTSLDLACHTFNVDNSHELNGEMIGTTFHQTKDAEHKKINIAKIADYNEKQVLAMATLYLRMKGITNNLTK